MRGLAAYIMRGRGQAILVVAGMAVLSWGISLANLLSAAAVALPTLRRGAREGGIIIGVAAPLVLLAGWFLLGSPLPAIGYALVIWLPMWLLATLLRESGRMSMALAGAAMVGVLMVIGIYVIADDPEAMWRNEMQRLVRPALEQSGSEADTEALWRGMAGVSRYLTGAVAAALALTTSLSLLIARWWQAMLFNPGGFGTEFRNLRMPTVAAYLWLILPVFAWLAGGNAAEVATNIAMPAFMPFLLTGFAILHALFSGSSTGRFWLTGIYVALMFIAPLLVVIMLIGFSDTWMDWRQRLSRA